VSQLGDVVQVTLIDHNDAFTFGFSKLDVMFGRRTMDQVRHPYADLAHTGIEYRQESVTSIDPDRKLVVTNANSYQADILVVALGAERLAPTIAEFAGGDVVIGVLGGFFKCPPAPYETAFMLHDSLTRRGVRDTTTIHIVTPMPKPIPISDEVSDAIKALLDDRGIRHSHATWIDGLEADPRLVRLRGGKTLPFDLFLGVPVHVAPQVVVDSGLTENGWIAVDAATLETRFPDVYAVGDVASAPVPRAGVIAEGEARTVAAVIAHRLGRAAAPLPFAGEIKCYIEVGDDTIGKVDVNFLSGPAPVASFTPPSPDGVREKHQFAIDRQQRWFGDGR
jgi:sulfide:quinone oxidoreductase